MKTNPDRSLKMSLRRQAAWFGLICAAMLALAPVAQAAASYTFNTSGNTNWVCPPNVTTVQVECWGGGGGGGGAKTGLTGAAAGGGGGAYVSYNVAVTPGTIYNLTVGTAGAAGSTAGGGGTAGAKSYFGNTTAGSSTGATVVAPGGNGGAGVATAGYTSTGGAALTTGSTPASGTAGATVYYALAGGNASSTGPSSGAGSAGAGPSGTSNGGVGGAAVTSAGVGLAGTAPGGGGSGALTTGTAFAGGAGSIGQVRLTPVNATVNTYSSSTTWTCPSTVNFITVECWGGGGGGGGTLAPTAGSGGGGGAGGSYIQYSTTVVPTHVYTITVGAGGTAASGAAGGSGGTSTFVDTTASTTIASVSGGGGGGVGNGTSGGTAGTTTSSFTPSSGATAYSGSPGTNGIIAVPAASSTGGGGGSGAGATGSAGGESGTAVNPNTAAAGYPGNVPGGGGSGACTGNTGTKTGGVGGAGQVQVSYVNTPLVASSAASPIGTTTATLNGNLTQIGTGTFTSGGFIYNTSTPATAGTYTTVSGLGSATGAYQLALTGLSVNTKYYFDAEAINTYGTAVSTPELNFWTAANTPNAPTVANPTSASLDVTIATTDGNPANTTYAIYETNSNKYVTIGGLLTSASPVFQTAAAWSTRTVSGLNSATAYTFEVEAQNGANVNTSLGSGTTLSTTAGATKMLTVLPGQTYSSGSAASGTPTAQNAGTAFTVNLYAVATDGVTVDPTYAGSKNITFTGPTTGSFSPATATAVTFTSGHATLSITLNNAVSTQITSGDGILTPLASTAVAVSAGSPTQLQALMPGETAAPGTVSGKTGTPTTQTAGTPFNVTVNAVDNYWNVVSSSHVVEISASTDTAAPVPSSTVALSGGTALVPFTFHTATVSGWTVTAHDTSGSPYSDNTGTATLVNPGVSTKLVFTTAPVNVQSGVASGTITVQRQDQYSNPNTANSTISIALSSTSTGTVTFSPASPQNINPGSSSISFTYLDTHNGTPTITAVGGSLTSGTQVETVYGAAPLAPASLTRVADYPDVVLNWTPALGVPASYNVYRSTTSGSGYVAISTAGAVTNTTYTDSTAAPGTTYYYVVTGTNSFGESPNSPQVSAILVVPTLSLRMPLNDAPGTTTTPSDTSSGGANVTATMYNSSAVPTDYHGASGSGVGGASGSHALDFSSVAYTGGTLPASGLLAGVTNASTALGFGTVSNWTATFWFNQSALWTAGALGPRLFSLGNAAAGDGGNNNLSVKLNTQTGPTNATMRFTFGSVATTFDYNYSQAANQWVFCAAVYDGSNLSIYIGSPTTPSVNVTNLAASPAAGAINFGSSSYLFLGNIAAQTRPFAGWLSDLRFYNGAGDINYVESIRANGLPTAAPAGLAGVPGNNQVALSWSAVPNAVSYNVKRSTSSGAEATFTNVTTTSLTDLGVLNYTNYYYTVSALNAYYESTNSAEVVVTPVPPSTPPTTTVSPSSTNINCGTTIVLTTITAGTPPLTYQWYDYNNNPISNATNQTVTLANLHPLQSGNYTVIVTNLYGSATNASAVTVVDTVPPVVTLNGSSSMTILQGSVFTDPGATASDACEGSLTVTTNGSVNAAAAGVYTLNYSANDGYNSTTNTRTVNVVPSILVQLDFGPSTTTVPTPPGFTKITTPFNTTGNYAFANVAGSGYTLTFTNMKSYVPNTPPYTTIDQDGFTSIQSINQYTNNPATFTLTGLPTNVQVTAYACWAWNGGTLAPTFVYGGATNLVTLGTDITSPSTNTLQNVGGMVATGTSTGTVIGQFYGNGGFEGQVGGMIFVVQTAAAPTVTISPASPSVECSTGTTNLTAVTASAGPLTYQWYDNNNTAIFGATNSTLTLANLHGTNTGYYSVTVANPVGSVTASNLVSVVDTTAPVLTANANMTITVPYGATGTNVTYSVAATDACDGATTGGVPASGSFFPLGTTTVITHAYDSSGNTSYGSFNVTVQSFSTNAYLTSLVFSPSSGFSPAFTSNVLTGYNETSANGDTPTVTVANADATAANTLIVNGVSLGALPNGLASAPLSLGVGSTNVVQVQVVSQDLAVTNLYVVNVTLQAFGLSTNAQLTSLALTPAGALYPAFDTGTTSYNATNTCANNPVTVTVANADLTATNWLIYNGTTNQLLSGSNSAALTLATGANSVTVQVVSQDLSQTNNYTVSVALTAPPVVTVNSASIYAGGSATLTATNNASTPSYLWSPGGATTASITVSPSTTTTYTVTVTDGMTGCQGGGSGTVTVLANTNAYLTSLTLNPAGLTSTFVSNSFSYLATNAYGNTPTVTVVNADATATNRLIYNNTTNILASGTPSSPGLVLALGVTNVAQMQVTAQDGVTVHTYQVNIVEQPSQTVPKLTNSVSGSTLTLTWPADHLGYRLLVQTNNLNKGVSSNTNDWMTVPGTTAITSTNIAIIKTGVTNEYYRLVYP